MDQAIPTRNEVMESWSVHNLTKEILVMSDGHDIVDKVHDVELALRVLEAEMNLELYGSPKGAVENGMGHTLSIERDDEHLAIKVGTDRTVYLTETEAQIVQRKLDSLFNKQENTP